MGVGHRNRSVAGLLEEVVRVRVVDQRLLPRLNVPVHLPGNREGGVVTAASRDYFFFLA